METNSVLRIDSEYDEEYDSEDEDEYDDVDEDDNENNEVHTSTSRSI